MGRDDLAAVWGPDGLATTDPAAIRSVPPTEATVVEPRFADPRPAAPVVAAVAVAVDRSGPSTKVAVAAAGVVALAGLTLGLVVFGAGGRSPSDVDSGPSHALPAAAAPTTVVSAAADLLHLGTEPASDPTGTSPSSGPQPAPVTTAASQPPTDTALRGADDAAAAFSDAMNEPDCDAVWNLLSSRTRQFFESMVGGENASPGELLCEALRAGAPVTTVEGPARADGPGRAVVPIAADGDVEDITLVREDGHWKVDLLAMQEANVAQRARPPARLGPAEVQAALRDAATAEAVIHTEDGRFTDDVIRLRRLEPAVVWRFGVAPVSADAGAVYVALGAADGSVVCVSAKAENGARFLLKRSGDGTMSYAGGEIPAACDTSPLGSSW